MNPQVIDGRVSRRTDPSLTVAVSSNDNARVRAVAKSDSGGWYRTANAMH